MIPEEHKPPEWAKKYIEVRTPEMGSYSFWYIQQSGHYKTVCRTRFTSKNKWIKHKWFKIKLFFYKLTHNTSYHAPANFDDITYIGNKKL